MKSLTKLLILPFLASTLVLASCNTGDDSNEENKDIPDEIFEGYRRVHSLSFEAQDVKPTYSPSKGLLNVLIVPIRLSTRDFSEYKDFASDAVAKFNVEFFGKMTDTAYGWNTMKSYYETASFGRIQIDGMVTDIYTERNTELTMGKVQSDNSAKKLYQVYDNALEWVFNKYPDKDWTQFDKNNDGCFDAIHFITNCGDNIPWNSTLWPHMAYTGHVGTHERPKANVYSLSSTGHFLDSRTQIHEQGHMLGLEDYYDYTRPYPSVAYLGGADMQDANMFDWNSYSKLAVGWVDPLVIDGSQDVTVVKMNAASLTGDCLIIPANYDTWNRSAYDEYFLIELFSPFKNNEVDWHRYKANSHKELGEFGCRMYHVDSRLWARNSDYNVEGGYEIKDADDLAKAHDNQMLLDIGPNNSLNGMHYAAPCPTRWLNYKLLTIIQADKHNTFAQSRNEWLESSDLFHAGDKFTFADYSHFLSKDTTSAPSTMDNGEIFPYRIEFLEMSKKEVTIKVTKYLK